MNSGSFHYQWGWGKVHTSFNMNRIQHYTLRVIKYFCCSGVYHDESLMTASQWLTEGSALGFEKPHGWKCRQPEGYLRSWELWNWNQQAAIPQDISISDRTARNMMVCLMSFRKVHVLWPPRVCSFHHNRLTTLWNLQSRVWTAVHLSHLPWVHHSYVVGGAVEQAVL